MKTVLAVFIAAALVLLIALMLAGDADAQTSTVVVIWSDTNTNPNESGYAVERRPAIGTIWTEVGRTAPNATTYTDATASTGSLYCYRVRAFSASGYSGYSTPDACMLIAPTGATVTVGP